ncbi:hypothetical protein EAS68_00540 [Legionella jordanis]|nr:hypothetical protein EAS68_00540 [Legionella jordanis]
MVFTFSAPASAGHLFALQHQSLAYNMPPGLQNHGMPKGLKGKVPYGWSKGKKVGWGHDGLKGFGKHGKQGIGQHGGHGKGRK